MEYLNTLASFCKQIKEQEASLHQIEARFQSTSNIPMNPIHPTIKLLSEIRAFLQRMLHMHESDTMHKIRTDLVSRHPSLAAYITTTWCFHCHSPSCIYEQTLLLVLCAQKLYVHKNISRYTQLLTSTVHLLHVNIYLLLVIITHMYILFPMDSLYLLSSKYVVQLVLLLYFVFFRIQCFDQQYSSHCTLCTQKQCPVYTIYINFVVHLSCLFIYLVLISFIPISLCFPLFKFHYKYTICTFS